jgi:hypothetical protein
MVREGAHKEQHSQWICKEDRQKRNNRDSRQQEDLGHFQFEKLPGY